MRAAGKPHILGLLDLLAPGALAGVQDLIRHVSVSAAWSQTVHLHVKVAHLFRQGFHEAHHSRLGSRIGRKARTPRGCAAAPDHHDLAAPPVDHLRQYRPAGVHYSHQVGLDGFGPGTRLHLHQRSYGSLNGGRRDQYIHAAEDPAHTLHRRAHLVVVAHVRPDAQRHAAGVLDLQLRQVQLGLAARQ